MTVLVLGGLSLDARHHRVCCSVWCMVFASRNILLHHHVRCSSCGGHRTHDVSVFARGQVSCEQQTWTESDAQASDASVALFRVLGALCTASGEHQTRLLQSLLQRLLHAKSTVGFFN
jgi:hypothetical protein